MTTSDKFQRHSFKVTSIQTHGQISKKSYFDIWHFWKSYCWLRLIWGLDHRSRSRSRRSRYILPGAGAGAAKQFYSEPEPELEPDCFPGAGAGADQKCHGSASLSQTIAYVAWPYLPGHTQPVLALHGIHGPVRLCPVLSSALLGPVWRCPVPSCLVPTVLSDLPSPVWRCSARPCLTLPGPAGHAWPCLALFCSILSGAALSGPTQPCLALPYSGWRCVAWPCPTLSCSSLSNPAWLCPARPDLPGTVWHCLVLHSLVCPCPVLFVPAWPFSALPCLALLCSTRVGVALFRVGNWFKPWFKPAEIKWIYATGWDKFNFTWLKPV